MAIAHFRLLDFIRQIRYHNPLNPVSCLTCLNILKTGILKHDKRYRRKGGSLFIPDTINIAQNI